MAVALDQVGLHYLAELAYRVDLDIQDPNGDWTESKYWSHLMWGASGFKAWVVMEHYLLSGDTAFLERRYPQMRACSRWQEKQRARTRTTDATGQRPLTYGLMPRGIGDAGLMDGDDRQHLWTPVAVVRFLRDALVMEEDDHLHLARGIDRSWLASGREVGIENASTHFGRLTYHLSLDQAKSKLTGEINFPESTIPYQATLHCRLPENLKVVGVDKSSKASLAADGNGLEWDNPHGMVHFEAPVRPGR